MFDDRRKVNEVLSIAVTTTPIPLTLPAHSCRFLSSHLERNKNRGCAFRSIAVERIRLCVCAHFIPPKVIVYYTYVNFILHWLWKFCLLINITNSQWNFAMILMYTHTHTRCNIFVIYSFSNSLFGIHRKLFRLLIQEKSNISFRISCRMYHHTAPPAIHKLYCTDPGKLCFFLSSIWVLS